jgi:hypothetical protein
MALFAASHVPDKLGFHPVFIDDFAGRWKGRLIFQLPVVKETRFKAGAPTAIQGRESGGK